MTKKITTRVELEELAKAGGSAGDVLVRKQFVCESIGRVEAKAGDATDISRRRTFCISTASPDRDNDVVEVAGWQLENFKKNPVVLWAHDYKALPIGRAIEVGVVDGKLVSTMEFADHDMANTVLRLVDGGFLRATSVGFRPSKYVINEERRGLDFTEQELLEFSIVPVPANPEALIISREYASDFEQLQAWAKGLLDLGGQPTKKSLTDRVTEVVKAAIDGALAEEKPAEQKQADVPAVVTLSAGQMTSIAEAVVALLAPKAAEVAEKCPACQKAGRVLSGANEARLRQAKQHLDEVLAQVTRDAIGGDEEQCTVGGCSNQAGNQCMTCGAFMCQDHTKDGQCPTCDAVTPEATDEGKSVLFLAADDKAAEAGSGDELEIDVEQEDTVDLSAADMREAIKEAVGAAVGEMVRSETAATFNRLRGRVD